MNAGVNLAFFTGNTMCWKTRWAASQSGKEADRTLITYKESLDSAQSGSGGPADLDRELGGIRGSARPATAGSQRTP